MSGWLLIQSNWSWLKLWWVREADTRCVCPFVSVFLCERVCLKSLRLKGIKSRLIVSATDGLTKTPPPLVPSILKSSVTKSGQRQAPLTESSEVNQAEISQTMTSWDAEGHNYQLVLRPPKLESAAAATNRWLNQWNSVYSGLSQLDSPASGNQEF